RGDAAGDGVGERGLDLVDLLPDLLPPGGAPLPGAGGGLRPGVGPAPAPPRLLLVGGAPVGAEDAGLLLGAHAYVRVVLAHGRRLDHRVDGAGRSLEPADPLREQGPLAL